LLSAKGRQLQLIPKEIVDWRGIGTFDGMPTDTCKALEIHQGILLWAYQLEIEFIGQIGVVEPDQQFPEITSYARPAMVCPEAWYTYPIHMHRS